MDGKGPILVKHFFLQFQVKDIHLHPELFSVENSLLTPTFKNKRPYLKKYFLPQFDAMYAKNGWRTDWRRAMLFSKAVLFNWFSGINKKYVNIPYISNYSYVLYTISISIQFLGDEFYLFFEARSFCCFIVEVEKLWLLFFSKEYLEFYYPACYFQLFFDNFSGSTFTLFCSVVEESEI